MINITQSAFIFLRSIYVEIKDWKIVNQIRGDIAEASIFLVFCKITKKKLRLFI